MWPCAACVLCAMSAMLAPSWAEHDTGPAAPSTEPHLQADDGIWTRSVVSEARLMWIDAGFEGSTEIWPSQPVLCVQQCVAAVPLPYFGVLCFFASGEWGLVWGN